MGGRGGGNSKEAQQKEDRVQYAQQYNRDRRTIGGQGRQARCGTAYSLTRFVQEAAQIDEELPQQPPARLRQLALQCKQLSRLSNALVRPRHTMHTACSLYTPSGTGCCLC